MKNNSEILNALINEELKKVRVKTYGELRNFVLQKKIDAYEIQSNGKTYEIEILYFWDSTPEKNIRVIGNINERATLSVFRPLSGDFIMAPDGTFIGE